MRVTAIDFETANASACSACSIGYCVFDEGEIIEKKEILIKPHPRYSRFLWQNIQIHGITPDDVADAEPWPYVLNDIAHIFEDSIVIAHNARFDMTVLKSINELYGIEMEDFQYVDTVYLSRRLFPELPNHKLNTVCEYLDINLNHHHAGSDALGCLAIVEKAMENTGCFDISELIERFYIKTEKFSEIALKQRAF